MMVPPRWRSFRAVLIWNGAEIAESKNLADDDSLACFGALVKIAERWKPLLHELQLLLPVVFVVGIWQGGQPCRGPLFRSQFSQVIAKPAHVLAIIDAR